MDRHNNGLVQIKNYITGGTAIILAFVCLFSILQGGYEKRIFYAAIILFLAGGFSLWTAYRGAKIEKANRDLSMDVNRTDEKDQMIVWQVVDRLMFSVTLVLILLYGILKSQVFLWLGAGMCILTVILLIVLFIIQKMRSKNK